MSKHTTIVPPTIPPIRIQLVGVGSSDGNGVRPGTGDGAGSKAGDGLDSGAGSGVCSGTGDGIAGGAGVGGAAGTVGVLTLNAPNKPLTSTERSPAVFGVTLKLTV